MEGKEVFTPPDGRGNRLPCDSAGRIIPCCRGACLWSSFALAEIQLSSFPGRNFCPLRLDRQARVKAGRRGAAALRSLLRRAAVRFWAQEPLCVLSCPYFLGLFRRSVSIFHTKGIRKSKQLPIFGGFLYILFPNVKLSLTKFF